MGDSDFRVCPCMSSLWDKLTGRKKTEDRPAPGHVEMTPAPPSSGGMPRTGSFYVGLWDFAGGQDDEMSFQKGDRFKVLGRSEEWWTVQRVDKNGNVRGTGNVPYNYLEREESLETQPWFSGTTTRSEAETLLMSSENERGAFLVRRSESETVGYVLSVKSWNPMRHFKVLQDEDGNYQFESSQHFSSLVDLVDHFADNGLEGIGKLGEPCKKVQTCLKTEVLLNEWERPKEEFVLEEELSDGSFADVYRGTWRNNTNVAIKVIKKGTSNSMNLLELNSQLFRHEIQQLVKLRHRHLVSVLAVCTETSARYFVTELMEKGNLLNFLRGPEGQHQDTVSLVDMGAQVADGMSYLEENNYVHSELAARNVLVGEDYICKVADFGLGRLLKETLYNMDESKFPYRWSAPEVIASMRFSNKSDVWSFGVLLYEIVTFGGVPYPGQDMVKIDFFQISCNSHRFREEPEDRPTFNSLRERLKNGKAQQELADEDDK
uniref:Tyrosine-protein kinase n=1 Tax=Neogobius melanostomus TaxID=47308 RepID=A0A8C6SAW4_9GOBI